MSAKWSDPAEERRPPWWFAALIVVLWLATVTYLAWAALR